MKKVFFDTNIMIDVIGRREFVDYLLNEGQERTTTDKTD